MCAEEALCLPTIYLLTYLLFAYYLPIYFHYIGQVGLEHESLSLLPPEHEIVSTVPFFLGCTWTEPGSCVLHRDLPRSYLFPPTFLHTTPLTPHFSILKTGSCSVSRTRMVGEIQRKPASSLLTSTRPRFQHPQLVPHLAVILS